MKPPSQPAHEGSRDSKQGGQNPSAPGFSRENELGNNPGDEAENDPCEN